MLKKLYVYCTDVEEICERDFILEQVLAELYLDECTFNFSIDGVHSSLVGHRVGSDRLILYTV